MTTPLEELTIEELEFGANHTDNSVTSRNIFLAEIARRTLGMMNQLHIINL